MARKGTPRTRHLRHREFDRIRRQTNLSTFYEDTATRLAGTGAATEFTASNSDNTFTAVDHGFYDGEGPMILSTSDTLPDGLSDAARYYVSVVDDDTFQLCTSLEALLVDATVSITDDGTGTHSVARAAEVDLDIFDINAQGVKPETIAAADDVDDL